MNYSEVSDCPGIVMALGEMERKAAVLSEPERRVYGCCGISLRAIGDGTRSELGVVQLKNASQQDWEL